MRPILFTWGGIRVSSYPAMLYLGLVAGLVAENYAANRVGLDGARVLAATVLLLVPALVGARLLFVLTHWPLFRREPRRLWRRAEGGAAMLGGLPPAVALSVPLLPALDLPFAAFWDVATITMLVGLVFARAGCVLHGCCGGRPSDAWFALSLPDHRGVWRRRVPMQLVEAGLALAILLGAEALAGRGAPPGTVFLTSVAAYGAGRAALQPGREIRDRAGGVDIQQALSAACAGVALIALVIP